MTSAVRRDVRGEKYVAAICAAPSVILGGMGLLKGRRATCYPGMEDGMEGAEAVPATCVTDGKIITACGVGGALDFACALITALISREKADEIALSARVSCCKLKSSSSAGTTVRHAAHSPLMKRGLSIAKFRIIF